MDVSFLFLMFAAAAYIIIPYGWVAKCEASGGESLYLFIHSFYCCCCLCTQQKISHRCPWRSRKKQGAMLSTVVPSHTLEEAPQSRSYSQPASWRYFMISSLTQRTSLESNIDKSCETPQDAQLTHMDPPRLGFQV